MPARDGLTEAERQVWRELFMAAPRCRDYPSTVRLTALKRKGDAAFKAPIPQPRSDSLMRLFYDLVKAARAVGAATSFEALEQLCGLCARAEVMLDAQPLVGRGEVARDGAFD